MSKKIKEAKTTTKQSNEKAKGSKQSKAKDSKKKQPSKIAKYFKDLRSEFNKVVWPSKKKVINNTSIVLGSIVIMGIFIGLLDTGLFKLLQLIINLGTAE